MDHEQPEPRPRFDPQAALQELERFGQDIQRYRAQREALGDEFETFLRSFKPPAAAAAAPPAPPVVRLPESGVISEPGKAQEPGASGEPERVSTAERVGTAQRAGTAEPPVRPAAADLAPASPAPALDAPAVPAARAGTPVAAIAAGAALLAGGALLAALLWNRGPAPDADPAAGADVPSAATPAETPEPATAPPAAAAAAATPPAVRASESSIVTERQVWMRVIVDGERVLEREVPAGTRIPLKAEKTIVIRTGDAGAVRLSIRGGTGTLLGREGEVVTRSFTVPSRSEAAR